jgi:hypothetical protein
MLQPKEEVRWLADTSQPFSIRCITIPMMRIAIVLRREGETVRAIA